MGILNDIMDKPPILSDKEKIEVAQLAAAMGRGDSCILDCNADFATVISVILLAGLEALDAR